MKGIPATMEVKVWMDGYQRVVCGVTEHTTCQDVMIALAQATGMTGRYAMFEKWRTSEHSLSPTDFPLLVLQKYGEYSNDVQLILRHSGVAEKRHRAQPRLGRGRHTGPPERASLKKSLTFSGAHRRTSSLDRPLMETENGLGNCSRNVCHSVESSELSSIASHSSASISPYTSLERQQARGDSNRNIVNVAQHNSKSATRQTIEEKHSMGVSYSPNSRSLSQPPIPSARRTKTPITTGAAFHGQYPKPVPDSGKKIPVLERWNQLTNGNVPLNGTMSPLDISASSHVSAILSTPSPLHTPTSMAPPFFTKTPTGSFESDSQHDSRHPNLVRDSSPTKTFVPKSYVKLPEFHTAGLEKKGQLKRHEHFKDEDRFKQWNEIKEHRDGVTEIQRVRPVAAKRNVLSPTVANGAISNAYDAENLVSISKSSVLQLSSESRKTPSLGSEGRLGSRSRSLSEEATEKEELIKMINKQEEEIQKCETRLKDLNTEISQIEGDLDVDEKQLESQLHKIEELEALEREVENELEELELVSWEEKLELERQKESRIHAEILLLQSSISESQTEILSVNQKNKLLTVKIEESMNEMSRFLEEKKEKDNEEVKDLETNLHQALLESQVSEAALKSLEEEIASAVQNLSKKRSDLAEMEDQLKRLNLEVFLQEPTEVPSTRRVDRLGLSRPGSARKLQRCQLSPSPRRMDQAIEITHQTHGYVV